MRSEMACLRGTLVLQGRPCVPALSVYLNGGKAALTTISKRSTARAAPLQRLPSTVRAAASATNGNSASDGAPGSYDYDFFCIGAGSGGVRAARVAAGTYGARVGICEMPYSPIASDTAGGAGGTCVLRGCVPKKLFVYCSEYAEAFRDAQGFGWSTLQAPTLDWPTFLAKKNKELQRLNGVYTSLLKNSGVEMMEGRGVLVDAHTVEVAGRRVTAENILVATGARAFVPKFEGSELCIISDDALELPAVPRAIAIIGGGYIAVEFAGIFRNLGTEVHLFYRQAAPLRGFDEEVRAFATEQFAETGLHLHPHTSPLALRRRADGGLTFTASSSAAGGGGEVSVDVDHVMAATGRRPNIRGLGLEAAGVAVTERGAVAVDEYSRTSVPSVWAVGDVTDRMALTPVALMEATAVTRTLFAGQPTPADHANVPTAVFSNPQIGTVGMTEEAAAAALASVDIYSSTFRPMRNTISGARGRTLMKLVVDGGSGRVVGCHMVGPDSAEIMQGMGVAVKMGVTKAQLDSVIGIHPSAAEEFVTMRTPTRRLRAGQLAGA